MKKILKKVFAAVMVFVMCLSAISLNAAAEEAEPSVLFQSDLTSDADVDAVNGLTMVNWAAPRCGYSAKRNILTNTSNGDLYIIKDVGAGNRVSLAEADVTVHNNVKKWHISEEQWLNRVIQVSADGIQWKTTAAEATLTAGPLSDSGAEGSNWYTYKITAPVPSGMRYFKIGFYSIKDGGYTCYIHNIVLSGEKEAARTLLEDDLTTDAKVSSYKGFSVGPWAGKRCGYSDNKRTMFINSGEAEEYLMFNAGVGKAYTAFEYDVTVHSGSKWHITQEEDLNKMLLVSDDGENWIKTGGAKYEYVIGPLTDNGAEGGNWYTYKISCSLTGAAQYVKLDVSEIANSWQFYVHGVKCDGIDTAVECVNDELKNENAVNELNGFNAVGWAAARCGYTEKRDIYTNNQSAPYMTFYAGLNKMFTSAEFKVTTHKDSSWLITDSGKMDNRLYVSDDGQTWQAVAGGVYSKTEENYDGTTRYDTFNLSWSVPAARYVKLDWADLTNNNSLFVHNVVLDGVEKVRLSYKTNASYSDDKWTANCIINSVNPENVCVFLAAYSAEDNTLLAVKREEAKLAAGNNTFTVETAVTGDKKSYAKLFVWTSAGESALTPVMGF